MGHRKSTLVRLLSNAKKTSTLNILKKVHRFTHGHSNVIKRVFEESGIITIHVEKSKTI